MILDRNQSVNILKRELMEMTNTWAYSYLVMNIIMPLNWIFHVNSPVTFAFIYEYPISTGITSIYCSELLRSLYQCVLICR